MSFSFFTWVNKKTLSTFFLLLVLIISTNSSLPTLAQSSTNSLIPQNNRPTAVVAGEFIVTDTVFLSEGTQNSVLVEVKLNRAPTTPVTIELETKSPRFTITPQVVTLNSTNWENGLEATLSIPDDTLFSVDGEGYFDRTNMVRYSLTSQINPNLSDPNFANAAAKTTQIGVLDNDPVITVSPSVTVEEGRDSEEFEVRANFDPTLLPANNALSLNNLEVRTSLQDTEVATLSPDTFVLSPANNFTQTITVTPTQDLDFEKEVSEVYFDASIARGLLSSLGRVAERKITVTVTDLANLTTSLDILEINETSNQAVLSVRLEDQPSEDVEVELTSSSQAIVLPIQSTLIFTPNNWNLPQTFTINRNQGDLEQDENVTLSLTANTLTPANPFNQVRDEVTLKVLGSTVEDNSNQDLNAVQQNTSNSTPLPQEALVRTGGHSVTRIKVAYLALIIILGVRVWIKREKSV